MRMPQFASGHSRDPERGAPNHVAQRAAVYESHGLVAEELASRIFESRAPSARTAPHIEGDRTPCAHAALQEKPSGGCRNPHLAIYCSNVVAAVGG